MKIMEIINYSGRNIFCHKPVTKMVIDLEDFAEVTTDQLPGFNESLLSLFPGLNSHFCSTGYEGGFVERLQEGTLLSHVTEHLALELQCNMGYTVYYGKTRVLEEPSLYCIVYEHIDERCAMEFGRAAAEIVSSLARHGSVLIDEILEWLQSISLKSNFGPSTQAIWDEAQRRHIPVRRIGQDSLLQLGYGKYLRLIEASLPDTTSCTAVDLAKNKELTNFLLRENGIPVPEGHMVESEDTAVLQAEQLGYPVVIKPSNGNQGKGVMSNIDNENLLRKAYRIAYRYTDKILVEKFIAGRDYRLLVVGDKVSAAAERKPPHVIGDGIHSIKELVAYENNNSHRGVGHERPLTKIKLDSVAKESLARSGITEDSVPPPGEIIYLRENGNLSTGGSALECLREIHPSNKALAVKAAKTIGLDIAGIDVVTDDISHPITCQNGAIIEVNAVPGLRMHLYPTEGLGKNVAADILNLLYPKGTPVSIPIISITGTNGKTTVTRMIAHVLSLTGKKVGMTCSSGTYIGEECVSQGDNTGPLSAHSILYNKEVEVAVLETARGGIIRKGLGYDTADVGIIVNISEDHLGLDGVDTLEEMAFVKALIIEAVKPQGYAILNADDSMVGYIKERVRCNLVYFSQNRDNPLIKDHISQGGTAVVFDNGMVSIYHEYLKFPLLSIGEVPITFEGRAICNVENSLAAVAGLFVIGVDHNTIRSGLLSFKPDPVANAGRFNLFELGGFRVLLDYGHNPSGYNSVLEFAKTLDAERLVGIIGMPGDRIDQMIYQVGKISGQNFSQLYIKEDQDLRGRKPGEVAELLYQGALSGGALRGSMQIVWSETEALKTAIENAFPGDLVVMFYEKFEPALELIQEFINQPINNSPFFPYHEYQEPVIPLYLSTQSMH